MRKEEIAEALLSIQAVFLRPKDPFTWASGIHSPIYCDNRLTLSFPEVRRKIEAGLAELVKEHFPEAKALFGTSTAGIAHAANVLQFLPSARKPRTTTGSTQPPMRHTTTSSQRSDRYFAGQ